MAHWRAINEKSRAVNNHNARKNSVIVILLSELIIDNDELILIKIR